MYNLIGNSDIILIGREVTPLISIYTLISVHNIYTVLIIQKNASHTLLIKAMVIGICLWVSNSNEVKGLLFLQM